MYSSDRNGDVGAFEIVTDGLALARIEEDGDRSRAKLKLIFNLLMNLFTSGSLDYFLESLLFIRFYSY